jgi:hypothetical protein
MRSSSGWSTSSRWGLGIRGPAARLASSAASPHNQGVTDDVVVREEFRAAIEARRELGAEMDPAVVDAFVARIEQRLADRRDDDQHALKRKRDHQKEMVLGSMAISIPLFAIAAVFTGLPGMLAVLVAVVVIAVVSAR